MNLWLTVDSGGAEKLFYKKPVREPNKRTWTYLREGGDTIIELPKGSIKRLIGKSLTWNDEPFEFIEIPKETVTIDSKIIDYIVKRIPNTFDIIPKEGSIWKVDSIVSYPNVNNGFPVVELSDDNGNWLRLPKSLIYG